MEQPGTGIVLNKIGQIALTVADLSRATAFYRDKLGMPFLFQAEDMAFFACGEVRLMLTLPEGEEGARAGANSVLYFTVPDLQVAYTAFSQNGVEFVDQPHLIARMDSYDLWMVFFRDSEGNLLGLMSEVARS
ncbi:MAG: VOC family protein [Chloroflexi bacterium]|nr:VOC family protein [Chloroflexota bacterium]OJV89261.1 MAG: hypothetical protein BGO39_35285 [Chloroflexi bacterium 54-19]